MKILHLAVSFLTLVLAGCAGGYTRVGPGPVAVSGKTVTITARNAWNKVPSAGQATRWQESWTQNGPLLDLVTFVGGLPEGEALVKQKDKDARQVPAFQAGMTPEDLVSMIEANYRIGGINVFEVNAVEPSPFLGTTGIRMDYSFVGLDRLPRRGRCLLGVVDKKLYVVRLDGESSHYFAAALPDFEQMVDSAALR